MINIKFSSLKVVIVFLYWLYCVFDNNFIIRKPPLLLIDNPSWKPPLLFKALTHLKTEQINSKCLSVGKIKDLQWRNLTRQYDKREFFSLRLNRSMWFYSQIGRRPLISEATYHMTNHKDDNNRNIICWTAKGSLIWNWKKKSYGEEESMLKLLIGFLYCNRIFRWIGQILRNTELISLTMFEDFLILSIS